MLVKVYKSYGNAKPRLITTSNIDIEVFKTALANDLNKSFGFCMWVMETTQQDDKTTIVTCKPAITLYKTINFKFVKVG